jgi:hypothetical protein
MPVPTSRWATSSVATYTSAATKATSGRRSSALSALNGRTCWPQPIGDRYDSHPLSTYVSPRVCVPVASPTARSRKATPIAAAASPFAARALSATCAVTAATAANARPISVSAAP